MVLEHEYCNAFCMMVYSKGDESEWHDGYKWFNKVSIHWAFVITNASEDSIIFSNQKLFEIFPVLFRFRPNFDKKAPISQL